MFFRLILVMFSCSRHIYIYKYYLPKVFVTKDFRVIQTIAFSFFFLDSFFPVFLARMSGKIVLHAFAWKMVVFSV